MCIPLPSADKPQTPTVSKAEPQPKPVSTSTREAREDERRRARVANGRASTLLTGSLGTNTRAQTTTKNLLGQ